MVTSDITNANARLIGFSQYRQLGLLRPPPPTFNAGNDLHASHANLSDLILASASTNAGSNARTSPNWLVQQNPLTGRSRLNINPIGGNTGLSRIAKLGLNGSVDCGIDVRIVKGDRGSITAKLEA